MFAGEADKQARFGLFLDGHQKAALLEGAGQSTASLESFLSRVTTAGLEGSLTTFQRLQELEAFETLGRTA
jgi:hypothetical protein